MARVAAQLEGGVLVIVGTEFGEGGAEDGGVEGSGCGDAEGPGGKEAAGGGGFEE